jgi:phospholipid/cholesterol/gamma-HCH transport system substrate-binding protein
MTGSRPMILKFGAFAAVMVMLTVFLFFIFGQYRTGSTNDYSAVFTDASRLKVGQTVRVAGVRVGTVNSVELRADKKALVKFDVDSGIVLTTGTRALVRYLNLVGDRYLELTEGPGSTKELPAGSELGIDRTSPALDLDLLLGGLKPVTQGLNPQDVNALSASLIQVFQGEGGTINSLLNRTTSFSNALADNSQTVQELIDNLNVVVGTIDKDSTKFSGAIDRLERLISDLSQDRDTIGTAITALDNGTASIASLLGRARAPLAGTIDQLSRIAPVLDKDKNLIDVSLQKLPDDYRKLQRLGAYGAWFPYYLCGLALRVSDLQYRTVEVGITHQVTGRCAEPDA